jgi:hypothetical protein
MQLQEARRLPNTSGVQPRLDDDRGRDEGLPVGWDKPAHKVEQLACEKWVERAVVDGEWLAIEDVDGVEAGLLEVADEGTLRQGPGRSAGPGRRMREHFGGEFFLLDGEVGDAELPAGSEHTGAFGQGARFARGEADHRV